MRTFHIRVNAKIQRKRWDDNDEIVLTEHDWSAELEVDGVDKLGRLLDLNNLEKPSILKIPNLILAHLEFDDELDFDTIHDTILSLHTRTVREIGK